VVNRIAKRSVFYEGLNLTRLTLDGMLKYPWLRDSSIIQPIDPPLAYRKWGAYDSELEAYNHARSRHLGAAAVRSPDLAFPSLTAQIIDWADDVTYAVHDLEDFYKAGLIPVQDLVWRPDEAPAFLASFSVGGTLRPKFREKQLDEHILSAALENLLSTFSNTINQPYDGSLLLRALVRSVSSELIGEYFDSVTLTTDKGSGQPRLQMDKAVEAEVAVLKELLWFYVIERPTFAAIQNGQRHVLETLFDKLLEASSKPNEWRLFPTPVRNALSEGPRDRTDDTARAARARIVVDYIGSMTDNEVVEMQHSLAGHEWRRILGR
jgi:dGTPase